MAYCTLAEARAAGATGSDVEVQAWIDAARLVVDRYTGAYFEPTAGTIVATVGWDGVALLHKRVITVATVTPVGGSAPLPSTAYLVLSSSMPGQVDAVVLGGQGSYDALILGAEPWSGGFGIPGLVTGQVAVAGTFGWTTVPAEVRSACSLIAAQLSQAAVGSATPSGLTVDDEGNSMVITTSDERPASAMRTTGSAAADALLQAFIAGRVRLA